MVARCCRSKLATTKSLYNFFLRDNMRLGTIRGGTIGTLKTSRPRPRPPRNADFYQVIKRPTLLPISQINRDLIQRRRGEFDMAAPISLRGDFDGAMLRALVLAEKAGSVTGRLLSLVTIYDGGSRADAARLGGVGLQTIRDWVLRFNVLA
jgi:hypothetical protein